MPLPARILHHPATLILASTLLGGCGTEDRASYTRDVEPVLHQHCLQCHSHADNANPRGGFSVDAYDTLVQGGDHGPVITPDYPDASKLVRILFGKMKFYDADGDHYAPMNQGQREALIEWIELGALNN